MRASPSGRLLAFSLFFAAACTSKVPSDTTPPRYAGGAGSGSIVGPLKDDSGPGIASWVDGSAVTDWSSEIARRDKAIADYLDDADPARAAQYGFRSGQNPRMAWDWFRHNPVGFNGLPFVLLKTILDLDPDDRDPTLRTLARIWKHSEPAAGGGTAWTLDHIGVEPAPSDYENGVVARRSPLPFGFAFENPATFAPMNAGEMAVADGRLLERRVFKNTSLLIAKVKTTTHEDNWEKDRPTFGSPGKMDRVFFSCAACHVGRVVVDGKMKFLPGMPNGQIETQYYSKLLMLTAAALTSAGFDPDSPTPIVPDNIKPNTSAVRSLYTALLDKARQHPETLYGSSPADIARAKTQALAIADDFPSVITDLIAVGVKTHFIYRFVAKSNAYKAPLPDVFGDRPGQMDAFGIASGLVAIHTRRPDNSYLEFIRRDNPRSPFFTGFSKANGLPEDIPGMTEPVSDAHSAADRVLKNVNAWAPQVPAPIDIKSVNWATERYNANWDGNQGASSRTLASGASATGDPRMVNVRIHEPLNPFIDHLPPPPYPFSVDLSKAREGKAIFREKCASCHSPRNQTIYSAASLGVDGNRSRLNTSVSRFGLAALVMEACTIYGLNNQGQPGADWCMPKGDWTARLDEYFRDTPRRVAEGTNGYKADALHGIWAQAPYLHNGSVPTLGQLLCPSTRPVTFLRGSAQYDQQLVGFEWLRRPERYSPLDTVLAKEYDTRVPGKSNGGHTFGAELCPDTSTLDPIKDREAIGERITASPAGALLAYLRTL
jgi:hypothetical protein